jgi:hypothetical protein
MTKQPLNTLENLAIIPDPSIVDKGFYPPNLTQEEMLSFVPSSDGVIIFNKDTQTFMTFKANQWITLTDSNVGSVIIPSSDSIPVNPVEGQIYLDTTFEQLRVFFMGQWSAIPRVIV